MPELPEYDFPDAELFIEFPEITHSNGSFTEMTLREPRAAEVRRAEGKLRNSVNPEAVRLYQLDLIEQVSGLPRPVVDKLPMSVILRAADYLQGFISPGLRTGRN